jgi:hypothetical protein
MDDEHQDWLQDREEQALHKHPLHHPAHPKKHSDDGGGTKPAAAPSEDEEDEDAPDEVDTGNSVWEDT